MLKRFGHWVIFITLVLHLCSCIFTGQSFMPELPY